MSEIRAKNLRARYTFKAVGSIILLTYIIIIAYGCEGGGDGEASSSGSIQGVFLDSPVSGVSYETVTHSGITNSDGHFFFREGETIRFMLGDVFIGQTLASSIVTPIDIVPGAINSSHPTVTNMIRFMQTLDIDNNPDNGITITQQVRNELRSRMINFNQGVQEFQHDTGVVMFMDTLNAMDIFSDHREMVSVEQARGHMDETLGGDNHMGGGPSRGHM